jgi:hypothetical protein
MDPSSERRRQDLRKLRELAAHSHGKIRVAGTEGNPPWRVFVDLKYLTAPSAAFPRELQEQTRVQIDLSGRYPLEVPTASIATPIFHPNVYPGGQICLGTKWLTTDTLDILVRRIIQIITFEPSILNENSPANSAALEWYRGTKKRYPRAFPTDRFDIAPETEPGKMFWHDLPARQDDRVVIVCPHCGQNLRLPGGKSGTVECAKCHRIFEART